MIIHNPILTGSLTLNNVNLSTGNLVTTGSNTFVGNQILSGSLTVSGSVSATGTLTAQTLVVQTITSSVDFVTGSTRFGSLSSNTHVFTGSVNITGSLTANGLYANAGNNIRLYRGANDYYWGINNDSNNYLNFGTFLANGTAYGTNPKVILLDNGNVGIGTSSPSYRLETLGTSATIAGFNTTSATGGWINFKYNTSTSFGYIGTGNQLATGASVNDFAIANDAGNVVFATGGSFTERMRIVSGGNVLIGSTSDGGEKLQVIGITRTTEGYRQDTGTVSINHNAATTIYSISGVRGLYIIYVSLPAGDAAAVNYSAYAIVSFDSSAARILQQTDGSNLFITLSGNNIQARQTSGNPQNVVYRLIKIV